ncbi:hypothetical protein OIE67_46475 [Nonomuraea fuscirosea]|uniref:hypothetical protein n=1 Tax=Nonomuraea fuscirosea TaxID=1291556 RepID=UPI002DDC1C47|nr:hypothetical protein [Nonomuraea fuscirosea]WSA51418.1 hypothetical protein OIE67_46475 [Nonomuraea fuscirosea]
MELFIYWFGDARVSGADLEDTIDDVLNEEGEVTGGGRGDTGGNIDVEIFDDANVERLMAEIASAVSADLPANAYYHFAYDEEQHLLRELLPNQPEVPKHLRAAARGICSGLNSALKAASDGDMPFKCASSMVDGTTVISNLIGRLSVEDARERFERWTVGSTALMLVQSLKLAGATAWEAHYNGVPIVRMPMI